MKTMTEIYQGIKDKFFNKTKLDVQENGVIDGIFYATSDGIKQAYDEIEASKNPHIWSNLDSAGMVSTGYMLNLPKEPNESDDSYRYRFLNWTKINEASNSTAIEAALINVDYVSNAQYVPQTSGVGTGTVYIIPKDLSQSDEAVDAVKAKLSSVVSPGSYIDYVIPTMLPVRLIIYIASANGDLSYIESNILTRLQSYINAIAPGDYMEIGAIEKVGLAETNVDYFRVAELYVNDVQIQDIKVLQKLESKLLLQDDGIVWLTAVN